MADGQFPHIVLRNVSFPERFSRPGSGGRERFPTPVPDREAHAQRLLADLRTSQAAAADALSVRSRALPIALNGIYLTIEGRPNEPLLVDRLERRKKNIELLSVREERNRTAATVFVPETAKEFFAKTIEDYRTKNEPRAKQPEAKGRRLVEAIGEIRLTALRDLWIDESDRFPNETEVIDWEVWLRPPATDRFRVAALEAGIECGAHPLVFPEDVALFARASAQVLAQVNEFTLSISRLARAKRIGDFVLRLVPEDQHRLAEEFLARLHIPGDRQSALCILDTGVKREHILLSPLIQPADCLAYRDEWGSNDHQGHGTAMAGVCGYGDLAESMAQESPVSVPYVIESVKIFPPTGQNPHELLGAITAGGVAKAELANRNRKRTFCLATSTDEDSPHRGRPTSWSSEIDQLCFGSETGADSARLFCVAAGNIREQLQHSRYPTWNDLHEIESPAQAWNALTVGGFTDLTEITDPTRTGWAAFAQQGDICPVSRTAVWNETWPVKPDIAMEGGNLGVDPADSLGYGIADLKLLTTSSGYPEIPFESFGDTSAATANAARLCATVQARYPHLWPETIRALVVDSAAWTETMLSYLPGTPTKTDHALLLRRYGFGVPSVERALFSAGNALTLIAEDSTQPYLREDKKRVRLHEMKLFRLPWPLQELNNLGTTEVRMRVTLSYFIEPNPAESARNQKQQYSSHGLRFAVKLPDENEQEFRKRINKVARQEGDTRYASDTGWTLGTDLRDRGSLHSDLWRGPASDLARRGVVAVFPVSERVNEFETGGVIV